MKQMTTYKRWKKAIAMLTMSALASSIALAQAVGVGTNSPHPSALLEVKSTEKGLLIPRMTTAQRNAISSPANGLLIYNTTTAALNVFKTGTGWAELGVPDPQTADAWLLGGNDNLPTGYFLGTKGPFPLRFRVNGVPSGIWGFDPDGSMYTGWESGPLNVSNNRNTAMGARTLNKVTSGGSNTVIGAHAGENITQGFSNVLIGAYTGHQQINGNSHVAIGNAALHHFSLFANVAIGDSAMFGTANQNTGIENVAIGKSAMFRGSSTNSVAIGFEAMRNGGSGAAIGWRALRAGGSGVAIGTQALLNNSGGSNVAIGTNAMVASTTANGNIAIGTNALAATTTSNENIAIGRDALVAHTTSAGPQSEPNLAIGARAGNTITTGYANTAFGFEAMRGLTTGHSNVAIGYQAMLFAATGATQSQHTVVGYKANAKGTSGSQSVAIGAEASAGINRSVAIGAQANATGAESVAIGFGASAVANSVAIGSNVSATANNSMVLGGSNINSWRFGRSDNPGNHALIVGTNNTNGNGAHLTAGGVWTNASDVNLKEDITPLNPHDIMQKVLKLPVTRWRYKGTAEYHVGPMAQDFFATFGVGTDDKSISSIDPSGVNILALQALYEKLQALETKVANLKVAKGNNK